MLAEWEAVALESIAEDRLVDVIPSLSRASGSLPPREVLWARLGGSITRQLPDDWPQVGRLTIREVLSWPGVGEHKTRRLLMWLDDTWRSARIAQTPDLRGDQPHATGVDRPDDVVSALRDLAAWGVSQGHSDLATTISIALLDGEDHPHEALDRLVSADMRAFAGDERIARLDPVRSAELLLASLDSRELEIARSRILPPTRRPLKTLEEIAAGMGLTRERIRQLEQRAVKVLRENLEGDAFVSVRRRARELRATLGTASPVSSLPPDVAPDDDHLADEVMLWAAGPYRIEDDWVVLQGNPPVGELVDRVFQEVADGFRCDATVLAIACIEAGIPEQHLPAALEASSLTAWDDDWLIRWPSAQADQAVVVLSLFEIPLDMDEIVEMLPAQVNRRSFSNALGAHPEIARVGKQRYALKEWGADEYGGIAAEMQRVLEGSGDADVQALARDLHERFGVSETSVHMYATMHPGFVTERRRVRLRRPDEPFVPTGSVELDQNCFVVEGRWSVCIPVTRDVLRGSGLSLPAPFAMHLGLVPFSKAAVQSNVGPLSLYWSGMNPSIGSLRVAADQLDLGEGDLIFISRLDDAHLELRGSVLTGVSDPEVLLRRRIGAGDRGDWKVALAHALGIGTMGIVSVAHLRARLDQRGNRDLLALIDSMEQRADDPSTQGATIPAAAIDPSATGDGSEQVGDYSGGRTEDRFHGAMVGIYEAAKRETGYVPTRFLQMVSERGGLDAAKQLLASDGFSEGLTTLWEKRRLDLTMEALVLQPEYAQLFTPTEREIARQRLRSLGYEA